MCEAKIFYFVILFILRFLFVSFLKYISSASACVVVKVRIVVRLVYVRRLTSRTKENVDFYC